MDKAFEPKLISTLREGYSSKTFLHDLIAGIVVGIVAFPLSIAFAIASGVTPEQGLWTAVIAGLLISVLSGSRFQIGGPTGAFIVIIFNIVQKYGYEGLALATAMAGILLILMGLARLGDVIKFIPYPVTVGFTSGIAVIIFTTQVKDLLGLKIPGTHNHFLDSWSEYFQHISTFNIYSLLLSLTTILIILLWPRVSKRLPGTIIAIVVTTLAAYFLKLPVETIGSRFGEVACRLPTFSLPAVNVQLLIDLSSPALAIALLAGIESLLSAVVADGMTGRKHRSNAELIAQGVANVVSPLFQGIPATGAIARTATNIKNGGRTPIAGIIHAIVVLLLFMVFGKLAAHIPMATLAGILAVVAYNMGEWHMFSRLLKSPKSDIAVLLATFLLTVFIDLTVAIEVGIVLAAFLFMRRMVDVAQMGYITDELDDEELSDLIESEEKSIPAGIEIFEINGPFFFGATDKFKDTLTQEKRFPKVLILLMRQVPVMDATGLRALEDVIKKSQKDGAKIILAGIGAQPRKVIQNAGIIDLIGKENLLPSLKEALSRAKDLL